jgi:CTP:molybdopterin cytidylyltransferase MocA
VLAAGEGSRFGTPKALVEVGGELLVDRSVRVAREAGCDPVAVVVGAQAHDVVRTATLDGVVVLVNDDWADGMGSSLRVGLRALAELGATAAVVLLVDQPRITAGVVRRVVSAPPAPALAASYAGRPGNPVRLDASIWPDVCALAIGDVGARAWMRAHPEAVQVVACDDLGSDDDIDTPEDLGRVLRAEQMEPKA